MKYILYTLYSLKMCVSTNCIHVVYIPLPPQVQSGIGKQSQLVFLHALLGQQKKRPIAEVLATLDEALDIHTTSVKVQATSSLLTYCYWEI